MPFSANWVAYHLAQEYHLQAVINASNAAALGAKEAKASYIPTPDAVRAKDIQYDELYPKTFKEPATYIRFSSTVEDCIGIAYCMDDEDFEFLARLNDGKDADGRDRKDKLKQCSEEVFEEVMNFFEETNARIQPFANVDNAPILSLEEMERSVDGEDGISADAQRWLRLIYRHWVLKKGNRPLMPTIKVRVLDTGNEADDADPYVCFRRREVRQTRKTRGRDAQVVEKLKKLRLELESARQLLQMVVQREHLNQENLEISRKIFEQRRQLKEVKVTKNIIGNKGDDEELLVDQKVGCSPSKFSPSSANPGWQRVVKSKARQSTDQQQRPPTIRLRSVGDRSSAPDHDLPLLEDFRAESEAFVINTIEARKEQHKKWNQHWVDETKYPITPPLEGLDPLAKWASFPSEPLVKQLPTPSPSLRSQSSQDQEKGDIDMKDAPLLDPSDVTGGTSYDEPEIIFHIPGAYPESSPEPVEKMKRDAHPACRLRRGRGGRLWLETRKRKARYQLAKGVVSDSDSDVDDGPEYFPVDERIQFDYRVAMHSSRAVKPDGSQQAHSGNQQRHWTGDQAVPVGVSGHAHPALQQQGVGSA